VDHALLGAGELDAAERTAPAGGDAVSIDPAALLLYGTTAERLNHLQASANAP
jgi:hypothetical protein